MFISWSWKCIVCHSVLICANITYKTIVFPIKRVLRCEFFKRGVGTCRDKKCD